MRKLPTKKRAGIASLELVLGLPFILALGAAVIVVGFAGIKRTGTVIEARHATWKNRSEPSKNSALYVGAAADSGKVSGESSETARAYPWMGGDKQIVASATVLSGTWDHKQIELFEKNPKVPHLLLIGTLASDSEQVRNAISFGTAALTLVLELTGGGISLPTQDEIDEANDREKEAEEKGKELEEEAEKEKEKQKDKVEEEIKELKAERKRLDDERKELIRQRDEAEAEQKQKESELRVAEERVTELKRQAEVFPNRSPPEEVPQSLLDKISAEEKKVSDLREAIREVQERIRSLTSQINHLTSRINEIDREIASLEQLLRDIESPISDV